ncbi:hypothetical protein P691DRAFT_785468 [Macrolepiota fuliginosa MF-IS2]|uniref:Uncharacterized protein n=1 Tax=Macrolepiota fuliginosa MF-IS2 TaxID=1400762 RepID=A0A9P5X7U7_9AGAR|nr:hypothetical protein P691DRAFT_785468 [Macrolepiota fuliginosa MF-IS2]
MHPPSLPGGGSSRIESPYQISLESSEELDDLLHRDAKDKRRDQDEVDESEADEVFLITITRSSEDHQGCTLSKQQPAVDIAEDMTSGPEGLAIGGKQWARSAGADGAKPFVICRGVEISDAFLGEVSLAVLTAKLQIQAEKVGTAVAKKLACSPGSVPVRFGRVRPRHGWFK